MDPVDVLNRFPDSEDPEHTVHISMYIFPRQFGLHNVFTSKVDPKETVQPFKDYTLREQDIAQFKSQRRSKKNTEALTTRKREDHVPRRLRGTVQRLISKMQKFHSRCAYTELLKHYCPSLVIDTPMPPYPVLILPS
jgi:telomerase reverse transcriptase